MGLLNMFDSKKENPFFTKLKNLNSKQNFAGKIVKAYYLGGVVYNDENYENVMQAISESSLDVFFENNTYNTQENNIELYWIDDDKEQIKILVLLDPVELYENEKVLEIVPSTNDFTGKVTKAQQIYP
jgi:hypothetical protein